jgi:hypothetical protein
MPAPNWAEAVTAVATAVLALGVVGAVAAAVLGAQQVRETRRSRQVLVAAEFLRRWNEDALVEARRLIASYASPEELAVAVQHFVADNAPDAYVFYREPDYFEQLAALEGIGAFDLELIKLLVGDILVASWDKCSPALHAVHGDAVYPQFRDLVTRVRQRPAQAGKRSTPRPPEQRNRQ